MIIYTVVGEADYEGISELGPSFTDEAKALEHKYKCEAYDKTRFYGTDDDSWIAHHPMTTASNTCHGCDSYNVVEHELTGLIDIATSEDKTASKV